MYDRLVTKNGDVIWHGGPQPKLGRKEIAHIQFEKYLHKKAIKENRSEDVATH